MLFVSLHACDNIVSCIQTTFFLLYWGGEKGLVTLHWNFFAGGLLIDDDEAKEVLILGA